MLIILIIIASTCTILNMYQCLSDLHILYQLRLTAAPCGRYCHQSHFTNDVIGRWNNLPMAKQLPRIRASKWTPTVWVEVCISLTTVMVCCILIAHSVQWMLSSRKRMETTHMWTEWRYLWIMGPCWSWKELHKMTGRWEHASDTDLFSYGGSFQTDQWLFL